MGKVVLLASILTRRIVSLGWIKWIWSSAGIMIEVRKMIEESMEEECYWNDAHHVIGKSKNPERITGGWKRIGGFKVSLLKEFLRHLPKDKNVSIGIYVVKKDERGRVKKGDLAPMHSNGVFLCPLLSPPSFQEMELDREEFHIISQSKR